MSDVKWCDFGQHPFTTAKEGWVKTQAQIKVKGKQVIADIDVCADCVPSSPFAALGVYAEDDLEKRLAAIESEQQRRDREELAEYRRSRSETP